jgi:hypothetical protein
LSYLTTLSETELMRFEKQYSCFPSLFAVMDTVPVDCLTSLCSAWPSGSVSYRKISYSLCMLSEGSTNPKVNVHVPSSAGLVSYGHLESVVQRPGIAAPVRAFHRPCHSYANLQKSTLSLLLAVLLSMLKPSMAPPAAGRRRPAVRETLS